MMPPPLSLRQLSSLLLLIFREPRRLLPRLLIAYAADRAAFAACFSLSPTLRHADIFRFTFFDAFF